MAKTKAFDEYSKEYEEWFLRHEDLYMQELNAIKTLIPPGKEGMEVGIGTGRFALPLGIPIGVEPSEAMAAIARSKGLKVIKAAAEKLPFKKESFDFILMVTTICFVDDVNASFLEAGRVLRKGGALILGFIDKDSSLGKKYQKKKERSVFYQDAVFYSVADVLAFLEAAGFHASEIKQTLLNPDAGQTESVCDGYGKGSFVVIRAIKKSE